MKGDIPLRTFKWIRKTTNRYSATMIIFTICCAVSPAHAEYRSVDQKIAKKTMRRAAAGKPEQTCVTCRRSDGTTLNLRGSFSQEILERNEEVVVSWQKPGLTSNDSVFAYTVHGGRINGEITTTLKPDDTGTVTFRFKIGPWPGNYPIIFRYAGKEEIVEFWVKSSSKSGGAE